MSADNEIICELGLTLVELQALRALLGHFAYTGSEPDRALTRIWSELAFFIEKEHLGIRRVVLDQNDANPRVLGWRK